MRRGQKDEAEVKKESIDENEKKKVIRNTRRIDRTQYGVSLYGECSK
jgi:hypothetical protein